MTGRRLHQCRHDNCDSEARWRMDVRFQCVDILRGERLLRQAETTVRVCDKHTNAATALMASPTNRQAIVAGLRSEGQAPPDFSSMVVLFVPLQDGMNVLPEHGTRQ